MEKRLAVLVLIVAMSLCSMVYAYDDDRSGDRTARHTLLTQLPTDKEMLFHQTMREVREKTANIREQIKKLEAEINDILIAPEFDGALFLEKTKSIHGLLKIMREAKDEAIGKLAQQFTREERKILAELISQKHHHHGRPPAR